MPFNFNAIELNLLTINGKSCTREREVCKALKYSKNKCKVGAPLMHAKSTRKARIKQKKSIKLIHN